MLKIIRLCFFCGYSVYIIRLFTTTSGLALVSSAAAHFHVVIVVLITVETIGFKVILSDMLSVCCSPKTAIVMFLVNYSGVWRRW